MTAIQVEAERVKDSLIELIKTVNQCSREEAEQLYDLNKAQASQQSLAS